MDNPLQLQPQPAPLIASPQEEKGGKEGKEGKKILNDTHHINIHLLSRSHIPLSPFCSNQKLGAVAKSLQVLGGTRRPNQSFHAASTVLI